MQEIFRMSVLLKSSFICFLFVFAGNFFVRAQDWTFVKEKDGIRVFTKKEPGNNLKTFRAVANVKSTLPKVYNLIGNVDNRDWWDKNVLEVRVLHREKEKHFQYYVRYDVPWPLSDRDLCVDAKVTTEPNGKRTVYALPVPDLVPERDDAVRIRNYWQRWIITPMDKGVINLVLEGFVDPGGSVPDWLYNMVITETPLKVMHNVIQHVQ